MQHMAHTGYMLVGLATAVPLIVLPLVLPNKVSLPDTGAAYVSHQDTK